MKHSKPAIWTIKPTTKQEALLLYSTIARIWHGVDKQKISTGEALDALGWIIDYYPFGTRLRSRAFELREEIIQGKKAQQEVNFPTVTASIARLFTINNR